MTTIELENGKYTITQHDDGRLVAERYREPWRDLTGDKMIGALVSEIERRREAATAAEAACVKIATTTTLSLEQIKSVAGQAVNIKPAPSPNRKLPLAWYGDGE